MRRWGIGTSIGQALRNRTRELGIRVALGAAPGHLLRFVLGRALLPVAAGVGVGIPAALLLGQWLRRLLYGVAPTDPLAYGAAVTALAVAAFAASVPSVLRVLRIDAAAILREE